LKYKRVAVGGTFNTIHKGHVALLEKSVKLGHSLVVGVTSDAFASKHKRYKPKPFEERAASVSSLLEELGAENYTIVKLDDPYGPLITDPEIDAVVVSEETFLRAVKANMLRMARGLRPVKIYVIPLVLSEEGAPLSSRFSEEKPH